MPGVGAEPKSSLDSLPDSNDTVQKCEQINRGGVKVLKIIEIVVQCIIITLAAGGAIVALAKGFHELRARRVNLILLPGYCDDFVAHGRDGPRTCPIVFHIINKSAFDVQVEAAGFATKNGMEKKETGEKKLDFSLRDDKLLGKRLLRYSRNTRVRMCYEPEFIDKIDSVTGVWVRVETGEVFQSKGGHWKKFIIKWRERAKEASEVRG